uniref:Uncharacterized protein n=1 Tax=Pseudo-nitzschia australis TaxID=44445 RepID=A0A7S4AWX5_9STRA|mmetsp:Transcript_26477/g.58003  ORF Transcript_26477/g.58003 Transcript_26477/m.58003 type:complete len:149 (+) Transcript_26477:162-608(+)|eukprot:CAMPEP_0168193090 /NCGR_PEP_ID=MMETSP0139_2-20121125/18408_1 /TAXON_ID=44445 /ORGANISM="Pseudo-nitzschia australis, Strain 10249 10 AB" /LENGTH=148 /DNA_ID=CAMNT_0008116397 /DNA_START=104 /DNA_END=550 /DNA_ORIENTATION=+
MLEVSTSTVAWISVVIVQFLIHYFIFGARRERIIQETETVLLEESLSFSTNEGSMDSDFDVTNIPDTPTSTPPFSPGSPLSSLIKEGNVTAASETVSSFWTKRVFDIRLSDIDQVENTPLYLMQTGNEMLKSCSLKNVVEEQIRSVPQ